MTVSGIGTTTYTWNAYNRLTSLSGLGGAETYAYNGVDSRVSRTAGGVATSFKRAGAGQTSPVLSEIQGGSTSVRYMPGVYEDRGGTVTNYHSGIKNAFLQTNAAGSQTAAKRYDAFGNVLASSGTWQGRFAYGGPHGYQTDASLQLLGDRYYDPSLGRFLTRDVAKDGWNWYVYCGNNPLSCSDPDGHFLLLALAVTLGVYLLYKTSQEGASVYYHLKKAHILIREIDDTEKLFKNWRQQPRFRPEKYDDVYEPWLEEKEKLRAEAASNLGVGAWKLLRILPGKPFPAP